MIIVNEIHLGWFETLKPSQLKKSNRAALIENVRQAALRSNLDCCQSASPDRVR